MNKTVFRQPLTSGDPSSLHFEGNVLYCADRPFVAKRELILYPCRVVKDYDAYLQRKIGSR